MDVGNIPEQHPAAGTVADDDAANLFHRAELVEHAHQIVGVEIIERTAGLVQVLLLQNLRDLGDRNAQLGQLLFIDLDANLLFAAACDLDRGDAFDRFETLFHLIFGHRPQLTQTHVGVELHPHDRVVGRIEAQDHRLFGILGERD